MEETTLRLYAQNAILKMRLDMLAKYFRGRERLDVDVDVVRLLLGEDDPYVPVPGREE